MKKIITLIICISLSFSAFAQLKKVRLGNNSNQHISLGIGASYPVFDCPGNIGGAANLSYTYYFMPRLGLRGELSYAYLRYASGTLFPSVINTSTSSVTEFPNGLETIKYGESEENFVSGKIISCTPYINVNLNLNGNASGENQTYEINTQLIGDYNLSNILSAACIGRYFGVMDEDIVAALSEYTPTNNRSQCTRTERNTLIVDAYNANPTSMEAAIKNF